ncbi:hypothetical protein OWV82_012335 [Melia azedarach]|uniref:Uncharacterized protein n=1 Tax=Melia azedarach TaxID=155640 RepID=A0ACC1Y184_MELAZ|nr:hypothetical protein OWV82_012335 [Melia azedarach]
MLAIDDEIPHPEKNSEYSCKTFPTQCKTKGQEQVKSGVENSIDISIEVSDESSDDEIHKPRKNSEDSCKKFPTQVMTKGQEEALWSDEISTTTSERIESEYEPLNQGFQIVAAVCCCCSWLMIC